MDHVSYAHVFAAGVRLLRRPKKGLAKGAAKDEEETVYVGPDGKEYRSLRLVKRIIDGTHYKKFDGDDEDEGHSGKTPAKRYRRHSGEPRDARTDETKSPVVSPLLAQAKSEVPFDETTRLGTSDQSTYAAFGRQRVLPGTARFSEFNARGCPVSGRAGDGRRQPGAHLHQTEVDRSGGQGRKERRSARQCWGQGQARWPPFRDGSKGNRGKQQRQRHRGGAAATAEAQAQTITNEPHARNEEKLHRNSFWCGREHSSASAGTRHNLVTFW